MQNDLRAGSVCANEKHTGVNSTAHKGAEICMYVCFALLPHRRGPDCEGDEAGQGGDGDGDAGVLHGEAEALLQRKGAARTRVHISERLRRHEHVVDA